MTLENVAKESEFTAMSLKLLIRLGVIHAVPTERDMAFLSLLAAIP